MTGSQTPIVDQGNRDPNNEAKKQEPLTLEGQLDNYLNPKSTNLGHVVLTDQEVSIGWYKAAPAKGLAEYARKSVLNSIGQIDEDKLNELDTKWKVAPSGAGVIDAVRLRQFEANPEKDDTDPRSLAMRKARALGFLEDVLADSAKESELYGWESGVFKRPPLVYGIDSLPGIMERTQPNSPNPARQLEKEIYFSLRQLPHSPDDLTGSADKLKAIFAYATVGAIELTKEYNQKHPEDVAKDPIDAVVGVHKLIIRAIKAFDGPDKTKQRYLETAIGFQAMREELNKS